MTTIRRNLTHWQSSLDGERLAVQLMSISLLTTGALLALLGLIQQQGLLLGLGAIGLFAALQLRPHQDRSAG